MSMFGDFTIILPPEIENKIMFFVDKADKEISGLGDAWLDPQKMEITITSAFLLKQECSASDTELDEKAIASAMFKAHKDEQAGIKRQIKFWWHSHVNMDVFWSATDVAAMEKLGTHGWFCHIVFNKKRLKKGAISYPLTLESCGYKRQMIEIDDDVKISGASRMSVEQIEALKKEFDDNYAEKKWVTTLPAYRGHETIYDYTTGGYKDPEQSKLPMPDDKDVIYEDHKKMLFFDEKDDLIYQNGNKVIYLEYQPERFPKNLIKEIDDGALRALAAKVQLWTGAPAKKLQMSIESEFLERGYAQ